MKWKLKKIPTLKIPYSLSQISRGDKKSRCHCFVLSRLKETQTLSKSLPTAWGKPLFEMCWFYIGTAQRASDTAPSVERTNMEKKCTKPSWQALTPPGKCGEKSAPNHPGKLLHTPPPPLRAMPIWKQQISKRSFPNLLSRWPNKAQARMIGFQEIWFSQSTSNSDCNRGIRNLDVFCELHNRNYKGVPWVLVNQSTQS